MPMRIFTVTGSGPALSTAARTIASNSRACTAAPPRRPCAVTLGTGQPKFMSMWSARSRSTTVRTARPHGDRVDAVELHRAGVLVRRELDHAEGQRVLLDQPPRGDHLAHVEAAPCSRHRRRNPALVMPAIGASTTGVAEVYGPIVSGR
jgi:hypothetical protein